MAFTQYLFDSLHDWHLKILLVAAIIGHLAHIFFKGLQINHSVVTFGIIVTAEPRGDEPRLTDFATKKLVTAEQFRTVSRAPVCPRCCFPRCAGASRSRPAKCCARDSLNVASRSRSCPGIRSPARVATVCAGPPRSGRAGSSD